MSSGPKWKTVNLGAGTPHLLMKMQFDSKGYHIQLTDLSRIWEEIADRNAIFVQARNCECSFDPGADEDNYAALLKYIQSAFNGEPKTSINLHSNVSGSLELDLTASLPGDLPALEWKLCLARLSDSALAVELVNPLLLQVNSLQNQVQQLVDEISAKDHVIQKITDKYETSGNDLTAVFPGASNIKTSRKKSQRSQLASHVKGLADFDEAAWRASVAETHSNSEYSADKLDTLLQDLAPSAAMKPPDNWWIGLEGRKGSQRRADSDKEIQVRQSNLEPQDSLQDDEFERQETPLHVASQTRASKQDSHVPSFNVNGKSEGHAAESVKDGEETETEDEDDLDGPANRDHAHVQDLLRQHERYTVPSIEKDDTPSAAASPRKLGVIGGRKGPIPQPPVEDESKPNSPASTSRNESSNPSPAKPKSRLGAFGGQATSKTATPEPTGSSASATNKAKSTLGTFGGKAKKPSPVATSELEAEQHSVAETRRIGRLGGRSFTRTASPVKAEPEANATVEEEKTEEQRANDNREKLKRELEEKAKQPVKKKRKF